MLEYNQENSKKLNEIKSRLINERKLTSNSNLEKYITDYIIDAMVQWEQSDHFKTNMTEEQLQALYNYDKQKCLLYDIIQFVIENEEKEYPLVLDFGYAYDMTIDYAENIEVEVKCLNCGTVYNVRVKDIQEDENGKYVLCNYCGSSFDID